MTKRQEHLDTLREIRSLMERSSRFISLSGLSGITAGIFALLGAGMAYVYLGRMPFAGQFYNSTSAEETYRWGISLPIFFLIDALVVLTGALIGGIYFTTRKARRKGLPIWDALTRRLLISLAIPLAAGGLFAVALFLQGLPWLIAPVTLLFYGLALINAGKYTLNDVHFLGLGEVALGLTGVFLPGFGLELWALGFGFLHIIYGVLMYLKYEHNA